jgi:hypothetical protein
MSRKKLMSLPGATLSALLFIGALPLLSCSTSEQKLEAANLQSTELSGDISVVVIDGKKIPRLTTADGKVYTIVGKLDRMIRDFYKGQTLRLSGRIESEPDAGSPGVFRVEEIILELR